MKYLTVILISFAFLTGCYYDDPDLLDPNRSVCDTAIITYSGTITPILTAYCSGCHAGANAPSSVRTDNYASVKTIATNGKLLTVILPPHSMPKGGPRLSDCNIAKIRKWVTAGTPNN